MWVKTSQVVPNCVLLTDVTGKTGQPIIPEKTILTEKHLKVLHIFLIEWVNVSKELATGKSFIPKSGPVTEEQEQEQAESRLESDDFTKRSFIDHYKHVVSEYEKMFHQWQNGFPIDMPYVREILIPLFDRLKEINSDVYLLHHYATKENYFYHHSVSMALLATYLAGKMGYTYGEQMQIGLAAFLSDSGMSKMNPSTIHSDRKLTHVERSEIRRHPIYSYRLVEDIQTMTHPAKLAVLQHHERNDRSGYPLKLSKEKIHTYAQIIAVCDTYHAMTSERIYQKRQSPFKVIEELQSKRFTQLDPSIVNVFINGLTNFSIGTNVRLSNGEIGEIVFIQPKKPTRPIVRVDDEQFIVLEKEPELFIEEIIAN